MVDEADDTTEDELQRWRSVASEAIAAAIEADPDASVPAYEGWTLRDLALHVVRVYGNARIALQSGSLDAPAPELPVERGDAPTTLADAVRAALSEVEAALVAGHHDLVWTPVGPRGARFWQRRILREALLHRWDADRARGRTTAPEARQALELIDEFLDTDVARAFDAGEDPDERGTVAIDADPRTWTVDLRNRVVTRGAPNVAGTATISGDAASVWLWLMRRDDPPGPISIRDSDGSAAAFTDMIERFNRPKR